MAFNIEEINRIAKLFVEDVKQVMPIEKAFLFGSHVKGYGTELSDVDICFFLENYNGKQRIELIAELLGIGGKYSDIPFEPLVFETSEINNGNPFVQEIISTGIELV